MFNFNNPNFEPRNRWRNAAEVQAAALEHEKRRHEMMQEPSQAKPQRTARGKRRSGWLAALLAIIIK